VYDQQRRSRFEWLREPDPDAVASPPLFMTFDLLFCDRRDLTGRPLRDRRARLEDVVAGSELIFPVRRLAADGLEGWRQVVESGYEGYVAKDEASMYEQGPTRRWLKVKVPGWTVEGRRVAAADRRGIAYGLRRPETIAMTLITDVVASAQSAASRNVAVLRCWSASANARAALA
jgi:hypothetical protein